MIKYLIGKVEESGGIEYAKGRCRNCRRKQLLFYTVSLNRNIKNELESVVRYTIDRTY